MGLMKRLLEEIEARGSQPIDKYACAACVTDPALKVLVAENASATKCDYCGRRRRSAHMDDLMEAVMEGIRTEWNEPIHELGWDSAEGGYLGETVDKWDLVEGLGITHNLHVYEDIVDSMIGDLWCERDYYGLAKHERLGYGWRAFCERLKYESRFFPTSRARVRSPFPDPDEVPPHELMKSLSRIHQGA